VRGVCVREWTCEGWCVVKRIAMKYRHLQFLIACSMQKKITEGEGLGNLTA